MQISYSHLRQAFHDKQITYLLNFKFLVENQHVYSLHSGNLSYPESLIQRLDSHLKNIILMTLSFQAKTKQLRKSKTNISYNF